jgi:amino acid adenylation domain-containing protein/thioester reductase-like protein
MSQGENLILAWINTIKLYPERVAVRDKSRSITYLSLYQEAYSLCCLLTKTGITVGDNVACLTSKNIESIVCFWGILLAGGVPVLLDQDDGDKVNALKIKEAAVNIIFLDRNRIIQPDWLHGKTVIDHFSIPPQNAPATPSLVTSLLPDICYILLTSGTTGRPKAVQISHGNVLHYMDAMHERIGSPDQLIAAHVSTFSADLGFTNIFLALASGGTLRIFDKEEASDTSTFMSIVAAEKINFLKITASHITALLSAAEGTYTQPIAHLVVGGERLSWDAARLIRDTGICQHLYNHYGPTETTIGSLVFKVDTRRDETYAASVPIGSPLGNTICRLQQLPDKEGGELYIGGPGVCIGYYKHENANEERIVMLEVDGELMRFFKTGDICRQLEDGNFEFLYRTDRQVKVRGYRIEIGEIELAISTHPEVENAFVSKVERNSHTYLEAYVKLKQSSLLTVHGLKNWLADELPAYKIPASIFYYTTVPYTANGKVDIQVLKEWAAQKEVVTEEQFAPNTWPYQVWQSWKAVLGVNNVSATDNFFETGGDSLLAIQLIGRLQRYGYQVHIRDINKYPVFHDFVAVAPVYDQQDNRNVPKDITANVLTLSQQMFLDQEKFNGDKYCQTVLLESSGALQPRAMTLAINNLLKAHKTLLRHFQPLVKGRPQQESLWEGLSVSVLDHNESAALQIQKMVAGLLGNMSIRKGKLFMAHLFMGPQGQDFLFLACHHLLVDAVTWNIIIEEIIDYYDLAVKGLPLRPVAEHSFDGLLNLAGKRLQDDATTLHPIIDRETTGMAASHGDGIRVISLVLPATVIDALNRAEDQFQAPLPGLLLYGLSNAVLDEFALADLSVDVEFHGRPYGEGLPDLSRSAGWWSITMPVHLNRRLLTPGYCHDQIYTVSLRANSINASPERTVSLPLRRADIRFNHLGHFPGNYQNESISLQPSYFAAGATRSSEALQEYPLNFTSRFIATTLVIDIQYVERYFTAAQIKRITGKMLATLDHYTDAGIALHASINHYSTETTIPSVGQPLYNVRGLQLPSVKDKLYVLLTGATGFLGIHLLKELLTHSSVHVYCIVRGKHDEAANDRLLHVFHHHFGHEHVNFSDRVHVFSGDLTVRKFGLTDAQYDELAQQTDLILHAAADINLVKGYTELFDINVGSTLQCIELAKTAKQKELHYISTLAVSGYSPQNRAVVFSEDDLNYGQAFNSDYEMTKFESEQQLRNFFAIGGRGKIYRVGHIAADSIHGRFQANIESNRIFQIIKGMLLLKQCPKVYDEEIAFSHVDIVSKGICSAALFPNLTNLSCLHIENSTRLPFSSITGLLQKIGYVVKAVELDIFWEAAAHFEGTPEEKNLVELYQTWIQRHLAFPKHITYRNGQTIDALASAGLYFPEFTPAWFCAMIDDGIKVGFFPAPEQLMSLI